MCQNYKKGCRDIYGKISELEIHQQKCFFRKVQYNLIELPMIEDETNFWIASLTLTPKCFQLHQEGFDKFWSRKMTSTCGAGFFFEAWMKQNALNCWIWIGSLDDTKNFIVNFSVSNNDRETFIYNGPIHTLDKEESSILEEQSCFFIKLDAVKRCLDKKSKFDIRITIKDDEDSGESDGSEEKPTVKKRRCR